MFQVLPTKCVLTCTCCPSWTADCMFCHLNCLFPTEWVGGRGVTDDGGDERGEKDGGEEGGERYIGKKGWEGKMGGEGGEKGGGVGGKGKGGRRRERVDGWVRKGRGVGEKG